MYVVLHFVLPQNYNRIDFFFAKWWPLAEWTVNNAKAELRVVQNDLQKVYLTKNVSGNTY